MKFTPTFIAIFQNVLILVVAWLIVDAIKRSRAKKALNAQTAPQPSPSSQEPIVDVEG